MKRHNHKIPLIELPLEELIKIADSTDLRRFITKYKLDVKFCVERVLFDDTLTGEETYICTDDVLYWQPHISEDELLEESGKFLAMKEKEEEEKKKKNVNNVAK